MSSSPTLRLVPGASPDAAPSDGELCRVFLHGDPRAFGELVRRHQETVFKLMRRYARTTDDALDLTQRAFLQALEAARRALPQLSKHTEGDVPFRAWLLRIAINLGKNHVRDSSRWPRAPVEAVDRQHASEPKALAALERAEAEALTRRAVLELPRRQREVFTLRIDAGLPFAEVAATLGITENNAKTHFHLAVKRLREEVARLTANDRGADS